MEESLSKVDKKKSPANILLIVIDVIAIIALLILLIQSRVKMSFFVCGSILLVNNACIKPFIKYIRETASGQNEKLFSGAVVLGLRTAFVFGTLYSLNKLILTYPIVDDKLYWFYNLMLILLIFLTIIDSIKTFINKIIKLKGEGVSLKKCIGSALLIILAFTYSMILPAAKQFQPRKEIDLTNIKKPIGFKIVDYRNYVPDSSLLYNHNYKEIWDEELAEDFYKEISKIHTQNIRNLDMLNYQIKYINNKSYYSILPIYEKSKNIHINEMDKGYIYEIKLHTGGEAILVNLNIKGSYFTWSSDIYRLNLSKGFVDELFEKIE